jgi:hypothetical protein
MRRTCGLMLVLVIGIAGAAEQAAPEQEKAPDYYPLKPGTKWFYEVDADGQKIKLNNQIAKVETIEGKSLAVVETVINGSVAGTEHITVTDKGIFRHRTNGVECSPPVCLLKYPFKKDETWETDTTIGNETVKGKAKAVGSEEVTVPAGKYKTVKAEIETTFMGMQSTATFWYAPDVGVVKQTMVSMGKKISAELEKFEPAK